MTATSQRHQHEPVETVAELLDTLEDRPSLAVDADLTVLVDSTEFRVVGYEDLVAVDLPSIPAAIALWRSLPLDPMDLAAALSSIGVTAELRVRGVPIARIGDTAVPSSLARRLGLGPIELVPEGPVLAVVTRRLG